VHIFKYHWEYVEVDAQTTTLKVNNLKLQNLTKVTLVLVLSTRFEIYIYLFWFRIDTLKTCYQLNQVICTYLRDCANKHGDSDGT